MVPTDFSEASVNTGKYALKFANKLGVTKVVFYHTFSSVIPYNYGIAPSEAQPLQEELIDLESYRLGVVRQLKNYENEVKIDCPPNIEIELLPKYGSLTDDINITQKEVQADIIVMNITGGGFLSENLLGSNSLVVARKADIAVIIVPSNSDFKDIRNVLLLSDFIDIEATVPVSKIKSILDATKANLNILHITKNNEHSFGLTSEERIIFEELFNGYHPHFHFINDSDFVAGINHFADNNNIDLVIIIPKKHSLLENIFVKNHTKQLAFHSHIPIMVVHN